MQRDTFMRRGGLKGLAYSMIELNKTVAKQSMGKNRAFQLILATTKCN